MFGAEPVEPVVTVTGMVVVNIGGVKVRVSNVEGREAAEKALNAYLLGEEVAANLILSEALFAGGLMLDFEEHQKHLC